MNYNITVNYEEKPCYNIALREDFADFIPQFEQIVRPTCNKVCIISDSNVSKLYLDEVATLFDNTKYEAFSFVFPAGEKYKKLSTIEKIYEKLIEWKFTRNDMLIALGGGVTGDMTGFAAATYLRGVDFIQMPTTLLSQVDSSVGGKTGVDLEGYKNMVGAFYMPKLVYMNLSVLQSLDEMQFSCGMGEVIKTALIRNSELFEYLESNYSAIGEKRITALAKMVYECCQVKRGVVERDPKEKGERALLNFGHTMGHAVEKLSNFKVGHGQCVAIGMNAATYLSQKKNLISEDDYNRIIEVIKKYKLPTSAHTLSPADIVSATKSDKKQTGNGIKFVLLNAIGDAVISTDVSEDELLEAASFLTNEDTNE